ncbi:MAG: hypothetical protein ACK4P2_04105 [Hyphomonas sp.]
MKKYLILAASLSVLGFASAQAQVFPSTAGNNSARITQTGNNNDARINQAVGGVINGQSEAEIIQNGNRNTAVITQTSATSPFNSTFADSAIIDQRRARGDATINQIHDYNTQRVNNATIVQITPDAIASIRQRGDRNTGVIRQLNTSVTPIAHLQQNGRINTARIRQPGINGNVTVRQGTYVAGPGASPQMLNGLVELDNNGVNASIFVSQLGTTHTAFVFEEGTNGLINITMDGAANNVNVLQQSQNGVIDINSTGTSFSNFASVTQGFSDNGSVARVNQSGSYGDSDIEQLGGTGGLGGNLADVDQSGTGLGTGSIYSTILQNGSSNTALVNQSSAYAQSDIFQLGSGHLANVTQ